MAKNSFSFDYSPTNGLLVARLTGFLPVSEAEAFSAELILRAKEIRRQHGILRLLVEGSESDVQATDTVSAMTGFSARIIGSPDDRIAVVVTSSLLKMQVRRALTQQSMALFPTQDAALAWLFD